MFALIPLSFSILLPFKMVLTLSLAIHFGHVNPFFPYLSDAGSTHPEAGIFSFLLCLEAILASASGWIRFKQIGYVCHNLVTDVNSKQINRNLILRLNRYCLYISALGSLSMTAVASFRATEHLWSHLLFAGLLFLSTGIMGLIQTWISFQLVPIVNSKAIARFRLLLALLSFSLLIICNISADISFLQAFLSDVPVEKLAGEERLLWDSSWQGYEAHAISGLTENLAIFISSPFSLTFVSEFNRIYLENGKLKYKFKDVPTEANIESSL